MKVSSIIEGLQIIQKSKPESESDFHFRAEHDQIFAGSLNWKMSAKDKKRLDDIGWEQDEDADGWRALI
jgi:hypothetical protein